MVGSTTSSLATNFMKIGQGVFELQGSKNWGLPLTWLVALTTIQHYRADCDKNAARVVKSVTTLNWTIICGAKIRRGNSQDAVGDECSMVTSM